MQYKIWYGLGGGFGGARNFEIIDCENEDMAMTIGWELACEEYDSYAGLHGLDDLDDVARDNDLDLDISENFEKAEMIYNDQRESWLDYRVEIV